MTILVPLLPLFSSRSLECFVCTVVELRAIRTKYMYSASASYTYVDSCGLVAQLKVPWMIWMYSGRAQGYGVATIRRLLKIKGLFCRI